MHPLGLTVNHGRFAIKDGVNHATRQGRVRGTAYCDCGSQVHSVGLSTKRAGQRASRAQVGALRGARLGPLTRPIAAGRIDIRSATPAQSNRPVFTIDSTTTDRAVSRPSIPNAAALHSHSLSRTDAAHDLWQPHQSFRRQGLLATPKRPLASQRRLTLKCGS